MADIIIILILVALAGLAIKSCLKKKKEGGCPGGCSGCGGSCSCHEKKNKE